MRKIKGIEISELDENGELQLEKCKICGAEFKASRMTLHRRQHLSQKHSHKQIIEKMTSKIINNEAEKLQNLAFKIEKVPKSFNIPSEYITDYHG